MVSIDKAIIEVERDGKKSILTGIEYEDLTDDQKSKITNKRTIVPKGELLTMSADEAKDLGFSEKTVKDLDELLSILGETAEKTVRIVKKKSELLLIIMNKIAPILILVGLAGIYLEVKTPGFGFFGVIGITAFIMFFSTKYIVGLADHMELLLFVFGIALLATEVFVIPGFGVFGAAGLGLILASVLFSMQHFVVPKMPWDYQIFKSNLLFVGVVFLVSLPLFFISLFAASRIAFSTRLGHQTSEEKVKGFAPSEDYSDLVGNRGIVINQLRPAGIAEFGGRRLDVVSDGDYLEKGEPVEVVEVTGNRIVVKKG